MNFLKLILGLGFFVLVNSAHTFLGTNVGRHLVYRHRAKFNPYVLSKRIEYISFALPTQPGFYQQSIQGILAYDLTYGEASCNVTEGGIGLNFVKLRMKSERGKKLDYDVYIYA